MLGFGELLCEYGVIGYTGKCIGRYLLDTEMCGLLVLQQTRARAEALFLALETATEGTLTRRMNRDRCFT